MKYAEAIELHRELKEMVGDGPGSRPGAEKRLREIRFAFGRTDSSPYFREKVATAIEYLGIWCSQRKWQRYGDAQLRSMVDQSLWKLGSIIEQELGRAEGADAF